HWFGHRRPLFGGTFRYRAIAGSAVFTAIGILFSVSNGFGNLVQLFLSPVLRAQNRVSVFLACFALLVVLFVLEGVIRRWMSRQARATIVSAFAFFTAIAITFQTTGFSFEGNAKILAPSVDADREFFDEFTARLGPYRQVLQLPIMAFPGSPPSAELWDYEHFRGAIQTKGNSWSYGAMISRPAVLWQEGFAARPPAQMVARARAAGFDGILVERRGYTDKGEDLVRELLEVLGPQALVMNKQERVVFDLCRHEGKREVPVIAELRYRGFGVLQGSNDGSGSTFRWDDSPKGAVRIALENYDRSPRKVILTGRITTGYDEPFRFVLNGAGIRIAKPMTNGATFREELIVPPGINLYKVPAYAPR